MFGCHHTFSLHQSRSPTPCHRLDGHVVKTHIRVRNCLIVNEVLIFAVDWKKRPPLRCDEQKWKKTFEDDDCRSLFDKHDILTFSPAIGVALPLTDSPLVGSHFVLQLPVGNSNTRLQFGTSIRHGSWDLDEQPVMRLRPLRMCFRAFLRIIKLIVVLETRSGS
ncbi:hypothetical protein BLNAU_18054 [Blattamonas nauphoetae]|uniref:Uncharacterized protein n=1 Tax=Blattamonas nauphoetae TaxID=2049346 RepID=A0ABQ9X8P7_9EUKA|nr:hypothetical protein BLNAU_18054 [Blattamonas nauphoetae]